MQDNVFIKVKSTTPLIILDDEKIQFGLHEPVLTLHKPTHAQQSLLMLLNTGVTYEALLKSAHDFNFSKDFVDTFLLKLADVIDIYKSISVKETSSLTLIGDFETVSFLSKSLRIPGFTVQIGEPSKEQHNQIFITVDRYFPRTIQHKKWLMRSKPVLPVICSDSSVIIGPVIETLAEYEKTNFLNVDHKNSSFSYFVSQLCHRAAGMETPATLTMVSALIVEQLTNFSVFTQKRIKAFTITKQPAGEITLTTLPAQNTSSLQKVG